MALQGTAFSTQASALAIGPDGTILVGGGATQPTGSDGEVIPATTILPSASFGYSNFPHHALLAQYTTTGALDSTYGTGGIALVPGSSASSIVVDSSGKVLFVDSSAVKRTTPPAPAVVSATYTPIGKPKNLKFNSIKIKFNSIKIKFNTKLNASLAGKKGNYQIRVGRKGKKFITIKKVTYDASTNTVSLLTKSTAVPSLKTGGLFALFRARGIHGADGQSLNGGNDLAVQVTQAS